jgi:hypothetical protein
MFKTVKQTDTTRFDVRPWKDKPHVTVSVYQKDGSKRMLTILFNVEGTNITADFLHAYTDAVEALEKAQKIAFATKGRPRMPLFDSGNPNLAKEIK